MESGVILPVVVVAVEGSTPQVERDVAAANRILARECGVWILIERVIYAATPHLYRFEPQDNQSKRHKVSPHEAELFAIGRQHGADVVAYYVGESRRGIWGGAAHPARYRGFWIVAEPPYDFIWLHELVHVVGQNPHVADPHNLLFPFPEITHTPPIMSNLQRERLINDPALLSIPDVVLHH